MFAITLLSLASTHPLDGQRVMLNGALPCVRLLNATGRVGCATPARAAIAPLTLANDAEDLSSLLSAPVDGEIAIAISAALFLPATALALASLLESGNRCELPNGSVIMITGGYKGQRRNIPEAELHQATQAQLGPRIHIIREYGMTELSSQLWDCGEGYIAPPWLRVFTQHTNAEGIGQLCFVDLANWGSCMAIETHDLGRVQGNRVELFGRIPGMQARGCSLVAEEVLL